MLSVYWLYRRSRNSVVTTLGVDVIETSLTKSIFKVADYNVKEREAFTTTPILKSNAGAQKLCKKKNLSCLFGANRKIRPSG